jgi:hypothetical protein
MPKQKKRFYNKKYPKLYLKAFNFVVFVLTYDAIHPKSGEGSDRSMLVKKLYKIFLKMK